jgi:hypothetical protein
MTADDPDLPDARMTAPLRPRALGERAAYCGTGVVAGRRVSVFADGRIMPIIAGGDGPNDPPATPPPAAPPAPPAAAPDLAGLQKVIDDAKANGQTEATATVLQALGFEKLEDAQAFVTAKREADNAQLTEVERREQAAAAREAAAAQREQAAAEKARRADIRAALLTAGAPADNVADLVDLVKVPDEADDAAITAAVETVKTKFGALFAASTTPPPATPPGPSSLPGGTPPPGTPPADPLEAGKRRAAAIKAGRVGSTQKDLIDAFSPGQRSPLAGLTN